MPGQGDRAFFFARGHVRYDAGRGGGRGRGERKVGEKRKGKEKEECSYRSTIRVKVLLSS